MLVVATTQKCSTKAKLDGRALRLGVWAKLNAMRSSLRVGFWWFWGLGLVRKALQEVYCEESILQIQYRFMVSQNPNSRNPQPRKRSQG